MVSVSICLFLYVCHMCLLVYVIQYMFLSSCNAVVYEYLCLYAMCFWLYLSVIWVFVGMLFVT